MQLHLLTQATPLSHTQACIVLLVTCSSVLHVVLEGCCEIVLLVLSACREADTRSAHELRPQEIQGIHRYCLHRCHQNLLTHAQQYINSCRIRQLSVIGQRVHQANGPTLSHQTTCCCYTLALALNIKFYQNICWDAGEPQVQGISEVGGPGWHWNSGKRSGQGQCRHYPDQWARRWHWRFSSVLHQACWGPHGDGPGRCPPGLSPPLHMKRKEVYAFP